MSATMLDAAAFQWPACMPLLHRGFLISIGRKCNWMQSVLNMIPMEQWCMLDMNLQINLLVLKIEHELIVQQCQDIPQAKE